MGFVKVSGIVVRADAPTHNGHVELSPEGRQRMSADLASRLLFLARKQYPDEHIQVKIGGVPMAGFCRDK